MRRLGILVATLALVGGVAAGPAATTIEAEPAGSIHPGIGMVTDGSYCTANFVFEGRRTVAGRTVTDLYLGMAAHCAGTDGNTATNGCLAGTLPTGSPVELRGDDVTVTGTLAYSSWHTMQRRGEANGDVCAANDFALVRIPASARADVDPTVPYFGGPTALGSGSTLGDEVRAYGNSSLRLGASASSPLRGASLGQERAGWYHRVYTASPAVPGDSGSGLLDDQGRALGVIVTLQATPFAGSNGVTDLREALAYANAHGGLGALTLVTSSQPYRDPLTD